MAYIYNLPHDSSIDEWPIKENIPAVLYKQAKLISFFWLFIGKTV